MLINLETDLIEIIFNFYNNPETLEKTVLINNSIVVVIEQVSKTDLREHKEGLFMLTFEPICKSFYKFYVWVDSQENKALLDKNLTNNF